MLEYTGEFGAELILFLPFIRWLSETGQLGDRIVRSYAGMRPYYERLGIRRYEEKATRREGVFAWDRPAWYPVRDEHDFDKGGKSPRLSYPDMRADFAAVPLPPTLEDAIARKPLLIIHNKYNDEWELGPVNHFSLDTLEFAFSRLPRSFTVVYIRHGLRTTHSSFVEDSNSFARYDDAAVLARHPDVLEFDSLFDAQSESALDNINAFKSALYSRCYRFVTCQGGGAHQIAQFSGSLMVVLHRMGRETRWAYASGYYTFMASPPPRLLICMCESQVREALGALERSTLKDGRVLLDAADEPLARRLDPATADRRAWRGMLARRYAGSRLRKLFGPIPARLLSGAKAG